MRHTLPSLAFAACVAVLAASPSAAAEKVTFVSGATMVVQAHTVDPVKKMIRLDLGSGSFISFPLAMVDTVEVGGRNLPILPPSGDVANRTLDSGGSSGATFAYGPTPDFTPPAPPAPQRSASERRRQMFDPEQQLAWSQQNDTRQGVPVPGPAGARLRAMAPSRDAQLADPTGVTPSGNSLALSQAQPQRRTFPDFGPRGAAPPPPAPPPPEPPQDASTSGSTDSGSGDPSNP